MICKRCGANVPEGTRFCLKCGMELSIAQTKTSSAAKKTMPQAKTTARKPKKKIPGWLIGVLIFALIVIVAVGVSSSESSSGSSSSGSSYIGSTLSPYEGKNSYEKELIATLPADLTSYILEDSYTIDEFRYDDRGVQTLQVVNFEVTENSTDGNSDIAHCVITMEDEYVKKTAYVTLYSTKFNTGWIVDSWDETSEAVVIIKYQPDKDFLKSQYGFSNITVLEDNFDAENGEYKYIFKVNESHKYADFTGRVELGARKAESYNYSQELPAYGWCYYAEEDLNVKWKVSGNWSMISRDGTEKVTVTINSLTQSVYNSATGKNVGDYYGSVYYYNSSYYGQTYEDTYDYTDGSGDYVTNASSDAADACLEIEERFVYGESDITLKFTADEARAYFKGVECSLSGRN